MLKFYSAFLEISWEVRYPRYTLEGESYAIKRTVDK